MNSVCWAQSQSQSSMIEVDDRTIINDLPSKRQSVLNMSKTASCGPDTVDYAISKATGLTILGVNNATSAQALSQYFDCPQQITISGAEFFGYKVDDVGGITMTVQLEVYTAGADSLPTGAPLASANVTIDTTFGGGLLSVLLKSGNFAPVTVSQPYCIVLRNASATAMNVVNSSYDDGDGAGEWLGSGQIGANWLHGYEINVGGPVFDADFLVAPFVTYDITASFTQATDCIGDDGTGAWTNGSSILLGNRMYNVAAFVGQEELSYSWDYGDGSALGNTIDGAHSYTGVAPWTVTLTDTMYGWRTTCFDAASMSTGDLVSNVDFSVPGSGSSMTYTFGGSADGSGTLSYSWYFDDGNTSDQQNPTHTFASAGTYNVCLTVTNDCSSDQHCDGVTASMVTGINELSAESLNVYPNPSNGSVTLSLDGVETEATINVLDVAGRVVYTEAVSIGASFKKQLNLDVTSGVYLLELNTKEGRVSKKLNIH